MKKAFLFPIFALSFVSLVVASPSLDQLFTLSDAVVSSATTTTVGLHKVESIMLACKSGNNQNLTVVCSDFLNIKYPLLTKKWQLHNERDLRISLSSGLNITYLGALSVSDLSNLVGIDTPALRQDALPLSNYISQDMNYYSLSLPAEQLSFVISTEKKTSSGSLQAAVHDLPSNWAVTSQSILTGDYPFSYSQSGNVLNFVSYGLVSSDNTSGGATIGLSPSLDFSISKYTIPSYTDFSSLLKTLVKTYTTTDFLGDHVVTGAYMFRSGNTNLFSGINTSHVYPFSQNTNRLIQQGKVVVSIDSLTSSLFVRRQKTPNVFYKISPLNIGFLTKIFTSSLILDIK